MGPMHTKSSSSWTCSSWIKQCLQSTSGRLVNIWDTRVLSHKPVEFLLLSFCHRLRTETWKNDNIKLEYIFYLLVSYKYILCFVLNVIHIINMLCKHNQYLYCYANQDTHVVWTWWTTAGSYLITYY